MEVGPSPVRCGAQDPGHQICHAPISGDDDSFFRNLEAARAAHVEGGIGDSSRNSHIDVLPATAQSATGNSCSPPSSEVVGSVSRPSRKRALERPTARLSPCSKSAFQICVERASSRQGGYIFVPQVGTTFDSKEEAYEFYNFFSWEVGFGIRYGKSRRNESKYQNSQDIVCQCAGAYGKENRATCRNGCKAMIRLLRTEDHGWYVSRFLNEHKHPLSGSCGEKRQWNSHSVIDPLAKDLIRNLRDNNVSAGKIFSIMGPADSSGLGVPFRRQTLKSLCARLARESINDDMTKTIQVLQDLASKDPNFSVRVEVDVDSRVKTVLWCNGKNKIDYAHFGDVVTFDTIYRTNLYNMPFGLFVGVNEHYQSTIFGGVLLRDEKIASFEWAFKSFVEIMNGKHPQTMLTDQCQAMEAAIRSTLPMTRHRWCKWHVLRAAKEKIGHVYSKRYSFKKEFHDLIINETSADMFEKRWMELISLYELSDNTFLERIYKKRNMWAKPYFMGTFCAGMTSTQRSESANHLLKLFIPRSSPMHLFVRQYNNMLESRMSDEQQQLHVCRQKRRMLKHGVPLELDAAVVYTKAMYERFSNELFNSGALVVSETLPGSVFKVKMAQSYVTSPCDEKEYTVQIEQGGRFVLCDCGYFEHVGMLCSHSLKVLVQNDVSKLPAKNILKRWTLWARQTSSEHVVTTSSVLAHATSQAYKRNALYLAAMDLYKEGLESDESYEIAMKAIKAAKGGIVSKKHLQKSIASAGATPPDISVIIDCGQQILPPERKQSKGRPATVRPKSRMDYVVAKKIKDAKLSQLCNHGAGLECEEDDCHVAPQPSRTRMKRCSHCRATGHNISKCPKKGI